MKTNNLMYVLDIQLFSDEDDKDTELSLDDFESEDEEENQEEENSDKKEDSQEEKETLEYWITANGLSYGKSLDNQGQYAYITNESIDKAKSRRVEFRIVTKGEEMLENFVKRNGK